jgi:UDP-glucose 4-epimerase
MSGHLLVTGGTGLVGTEIVRRLLAAGFSVTLLSRRPPRVTSARLRWIRADLAGQFGSVLQTVGGVDALVHAAAVTSDRGTANSLDELQETNLRAGNELFRWCGQQGVKRVVFISSLSFLTRPLRPPIDESHPVGAATPYGMSKLWNEIQLERHARECGLTPVALRVSSPIPATFEQLPSTVVKTWIEAALKGESLKVFGSGARSQDFVACSDIAEAVLRSIQAEGARGVYHIGSGVPLSMRDLAQRIAARRNTPIVFQGTDANEHDRWELSLEKARRELGYVPGLSGPQAIEALLGTVL